MIDLSLALFANAGERERDARIVASRRPGGHVYPIGWQPE